MQEDIGLSSVSITIWKKDILRIFITKFVSFLQWHNQALHVYVKSLLRGRSRRFFFVSAQYLPSHAFKKAQVGLSSIVEKKDVFCINMYS